MDKRVSTGLADVVKITGSIPAPAPTSWTVFSGSIVAGRWNKSAQILHVPKFFFNSWYLVLLLERKSTGKLVWLTWIQLKLSFCVLSRVGREIISLEFKRSQSLLQPNMFYSPVVLSDQVWVCKSIRLVFILKASYREWDCKLTLSSWWGIWRLFYWLQCTSPLRWERRRGLPQRFSPPHFQEDWTCWG